MKTQNEKLIAIALESIERRNNKIARLEREIATERESRQRLIGIVESLSSPPQFDAASAIISEQLN